MMDSVFLCVVCLLCLYKIFFFFLDHFRFAKQRWPARCQSYSGSHKSAKGCFLSGNFFPHLRSVLPNLTFTSYKYKQGSSAKLMSLVLCFRRMWKWRNHKQTSWCWSRICKRVLLRGSSFSGYLNLAPAARAHA